MAKLHHSILKIIFSAASRNDPAAAPLKADKVKNILIVNTTAIGDTLLSTPAIRNIRKNFPASRITALVSKNAEAVLRGNPRIDGFIKYPGRINIAYVLKLPRLLRELRKGRFDLAIVLHANDPDTGPLVYVTGAPWRMKVNWEETKFASLYSFPVRDASPAGHEVDIKLKNLGSYGIKAGGRELELFLFEADHAEAKVFAERLKKNKNGFVIVHPFGSKKNKWWNADNVKRFCVLLNERLGYTPVVIGGPGEAPVAEDIARASGGVSAAGKLSIRGSSALIYNSELIVTTDSGPMHIAQALHVPTIALFGPDDPETTGPVNKKDIVIQKGLQCVPCRKKTCEFSENNCMTSITPEEVLESVQNRLSKKIRSFV